MINSLCLESWLINGFEPLWLLELPANWLLYNEFGLFDILYNNPFIN